MKKLTFDQVTVMKNSRVILDDINLELFFGKIYGFIGVNGAGKTTIFKTILGFVDFIGEIRIDDEKFNYDKFGKIGAVIPLPEYYDKLTIQEILEEHSVYMPNFSTMKFQNIIKDFNLNISFKMKLKELSLGMKQKINIGLAFAHTPDILVLDEPFNALDKESILVLKKIIKDFCTEGKLVLVSSHHSSDLQDIVTDSIVLDEGKVII